MKTTRFILLFFFIFGFTIQGFSQDFLFTKIRAKTVGENAQYQVKLQEHRLLNGLQKGQQIDFQLNDQRFLQTIKRKQNLRFGYTSITGHPKNGNSYSHLLIRDGKLTGILHFDGKPYRLSHKNGDYQFFSITEEAHRCSFDELSKNSEVLQKSIADADGEQANLVFDIEDYSNTTTVDILILYTTDAKNWADTSSSVTDIFETLAYNESIKNDIIQNSELALKIRFVKFLEIASNNTLNNSIILTAIQQNNYASISSSDTVNINQLRDKYGADLVSLIDVTNGGGLGYQINGLGGSAEVGFTVARVQQLHFTSTLMHEIGHNFGNAHGRTQSSNAATDKGGIFQFSTGHYLETTDMTNHNTIMHYGDSNSSEIPYFSNPRVIYSPGDVNLPTGTYDGNGGPSDNALSMSITKNWIANYRQTVVDPASISLMTTAIADTVFPSGISRQPIIIENTGSSDLEVKLDGQMQFSSSLKRTKTIKQSLNINYDFEESEGFETGSYIGYNNWISVDDEAFEISTTEAASGVQSLKAPSASSPFIQSPYFSTTSRYSSYNISMKVYSEGGAADAYLEFSSADSINEVGGLLLQGTGEVGFYGMDGAKAYHVSPSDYQLTDQWVDVNILVSTDNGGTVSYEYGPDISQTFTGNGFYYPEIFYLALLNSSSNSVYVDDIKITAEDLYGPALTINDHTVTIRPGDTDTVFVNFYGNENDEGFYEGNIYLETNDPDNESMTIPVDLYIDPNNQYPNGQFAIELTGQEGFRLLSAPVDLNLKDLLEPLHTQGAMNADFTNGTPVVWTWNKNFTGITNLGWTPVADLDTTLTAGDAFLVYVFDEDVYGDSTSRGFPKLLPILGTTVSSASPDINQNADGLTLIGNPYPSTIDWNQVAKNEIAKAVYVYDPNTQSWQSSVDGIGDITNGLIKPFQGFIVQTASSVLNGPSIIFSSDDIAFGGDFYGKSSKKSFARFEIEDPESGLSNSAYVVFNNQANEGKDAYDALEFLPLSTRYLYVSTIAGDGTKLDINALPDFEQSLEVPLNIQSNIAESIKFILTDNTRLENLDISLTNGEWSKEIKLNKPVAFDYNPSPFVQKNGFPVSAKKEKSSEYTLVFTKLNTTSTEEPDVPQEFELLQNYPNPFNPSTSIRFGLPTSSSVKLSIYTVLGQLVDVLINEPLQAGFHTVDFNAENLSSGVYLFRIESGSFIQTKKMVLMK